MEVRDLEGRVTEMRGPGQGCVANEGGISTHFVSGSGRQHPRALRQRKASGSAGISGKHQRRAKLPRGEKALSQQTDHSNRECCWAHRRGPQAQATSSIARSKQAARAAG
ncbi:hypothetical protein GQ54DRAFT_8023 [Martensiomyces pterosporus]|nr:hypothetical protein GQ54DRAFT_8023 [Martensiomyces pterosporus]